MLKRLTTLFILVCAAVAFAQIKPAFQAFDADYLQLAEASKGYHHFIIRVDFAPWAFVAEGDVKAPQGDFDLLFNSMDNDELYIVIAYSPSPIEGSDGLEYQAGIYDVMLYYSDGTDELPTSIKNLKINLLQPIANDSWATGALADAQGKRGNPGDVFKNSENANAIFQASATPLSKAQAKAMAKDAANQKKLALKARRDSVAAAEQAARDAEIAEKARRDSIAAAAKNRRTAAPAAAAAANSSSDGLTPRQRKLQAMQAQQAPAAKTAPAATAAPAATNSSDGLTPRQRRLQAQQAQQNSAPAASASFDPCDNPSFTPLQKKRCRMNK